MFDRKKNGASFTPFSNTFSQIGIHIKIINAGGQNIYMQFLFPS